MMKNKITKIIVNGVVLAAMAALGITVYQLGTSTKKEEKVQEVVPLNTVEGEDSTEEMSLVDAGTDQVEADLENSAELGGDLTGDILEETDSYGDVQNLDGSEGILTDGMGFETADVSAAAYNLPEINFSEDTLMEWPVNGNILVDYSMDQTTYFPTLDQYKLSPAISVQAVEDAPVVAAVAGKVYSIENDVQTGMTLTMELGNGYQAVYGQLKDICVTEGDIVKKGDAIGCISAPTKYYSTEGSNLYFAMKKDGKPIDPIAYLP